VISSGVVATLTWKSSGGVFWNVSVNPVDYPQNPVLLKRMPRQLANDTFARIPPEPAS